MVPGTPYDSARVDAILAEKGATVLKGGQRIWPF
jgi:hypothetical protein